MTSKRNIVIGATLVVLLAVLGTGQSLLTKVAAQGSSGVMAPKFEVDPNWPKPLPNGYQLGQTIGVAIDANDHVWIVHRANPDDVEAAKEKGTGLCCVAGDPIMEFDQAGNLLRHWGGKDGPGYQWPSSNHGIWIDYKQNVWIGGNGNGSDGMVLKFTQDGKFLNMFGIKKQGLGPDSLAQDRFYLVAKIHVYPKTNEAFISDGYGNKRVAVLDADTGKMKRFWGAYGNPPDDKLDLGAVHAGGAARQRVPRSRPLRRALQRWHRLRLRSYQRPPPDVHARRQVPERDPGAAGVQGRRIHMGRGLLERPRAEVSVCGRRPQSARPHLRSQVDDGADQLRNRWPLPRPVLLVAQHRGRFERQYLYDRNVSGPPRAEVHV